MSDIDGVSRLIGVLQAQDEALSKAVASEREETREALSDIRKELATFNALKNKAWGVISVVVIIAGLAGAAAKTAIAGFFMGEQ